MVSLLGLFEERVENNQGRVSTSWGFPFSPLDWRRIEPGETPDFTRSQIRGDFHHADPGRG